MDNPEIRWYDIRTLGVEGQGWADTEKPFDRLPARAKASVREPVWQRGTLTLTNEQGSL